MSRPRSKRLWFTLYEPMSVNASTSGKRIEYGIFSTLTHRPTSGRFRISRMTFPT